VQRNLRFVQRGLDPGEKVFALSHSHFTSGPQNRILTVTPPP
jgi:hypothetical protein